MLDHTQAKLWRKVRKYGRFLQMVPFLEMVAVCNSLAMGQADEDSDIDLFIIVKQGRLFTARVLVTILMQILGVRRYRHLVRERFCLSFFIDDSVMNFNHLQRGKDFYLAAWVKSLKPILDKVSADNGLFVSENFLDSNKEWLKSFDLSDLGIKIDRSFLLKDSRYFSIVRSCSEFIFRGRFGNFVENLLARWQLKRARLKAEKLKNTDGIVITNNVLKFHNMDRRDEFNTKVLDDRSF